MKKYNFVFNIGDRVKVKELNIKGKVSGIFIGAEGVTYRIRYFFDSKVNEIYFQDDELELVADEDVTVNPLNPNKK